MSALGLDAAVTVAKGTRNSRSPSTARAGAVGYAGRAPAGFTLRD